MNRRDILIISSHGTLDLQEAGVGSRTQFSRSAAAHLTGQSPRRLYLLIVELDALILADCGNAKLAIVQLTFFAK